MKRVFVLAGLIMLVSAPSVFCQFDLVKPNPNEPSLTFFTKGNFGPLRATYSPAGSLSEDQDGTGKGLEFHALWEQPTSPKASFLLYGAFGVGKNTLDGTGTYVRTELKQTAFSLGMGVRLRLK